LFGTTVTSKFEPDSSFYHFATLLRASIRYAPRPTYDVFLNLFTYLRFR